MAVSETEGSCLNVYGVSQFGVVADREYYGMCKAGKSGVHFTVFIKLPNGGTSVDSILYKITRTLMGAFLPLRIE